MTSYGFIDDVLHVTFDGRITIHDLFAFLHEFSQIENLPLHLKVFYDIRSATLDLRLDEIDKLSKSAEVETEKCISVKTAFCVEDPKITAYAMLFSWLPENSKIKREQFSTKEAALEWLNSN